MSQQSFRYVQPYHAKLTIQNRTWCPRLGHPSSPDSVRSMEQELQIINLTCEPGRPLSPMLVTCYCPCAGWQPLLVTCIGPLGLDPPSPFCPVGNCPHRGPPSIPSHLHPSLVCIIEEPRAGCAPSLGKDRSLVATARTLMSNPAVALNQSKGLTVAEGSPWLSCFLCSPKIAALCNIPEKFLEKNNIKII